MTASTKFFALPVHGEAFLLQTNHGGRHWTVLVDAGHNGASARKPHPVIAAIGQVAPNTKQVDIAVCTHSDDDHSGGFPNFISEWIKAGNRLSEVWLPWRWSVAVPKATIDPDGLLVDLRDGARDLAARIVAARPMTFDAGEQELPDEDEIIRSLSAELQADGVRVEAEEWSALTAEGLARSFETHQAASMRALGLNESGLRQVRRIIEESESDEARSLARLIPESVYLYADPIMVRAASLFRSAAEKVEKIRDIYEAAAAHNIRIRWFDFGAFEKGAAASGGIKNFLIPLSAVEMAEPRKPKSGYEIALSLRLSEQNVESLVLQRIEDNNSPAVFFLGDSRLAFGINKPEKSFPKPAEIPNRPAIVTAPHHGSRMNDHAYGVLEDWLGKTLENNSFYVRNGGMSKQTLEGFLKRAERRCAQCTKCFTETRKQPVIVEANAGQWIWPPDAKKCGTVRKNSPAIIVAAI